VHPDQKLGLSLAVVIVGFSAAFCFRQQPAVLDRAPLLEAGEALDARIEHLSVRAYTEREGALDGADFQRPATTLNKAPATRQRSAAALPVVALAPAAEPIRFDPRPPPSLQAADVTPFPAARPVIHPVAGTAPVVSPAAAPSTAPAALMSIRPVAPMTAQIPTNGLPQWPDPRPPLQTAPVAARVGRDPLTSGPSRELPTGSKVPLVDGPTESAGRNKPPDPGAAPSAPTAVTTSPETFRTHAIQPGDTLSDLASVYLGSADRYDEIFDCNRDVLSSPDHLQVGVVLQIPVPSAGRDDAEQSPEGENVSRPLHEPSHELEIRLGSG
jgi:hypothetical protein